jgi:hypothetical protein
VVALASVGVARAADRVWTNPDGGSFNDAGNWQGGVVPSTTDTARFDFDGHASYMVYFDRPTNFGGAMVGDEQVTFDLRGSETRAVGKRPPAPPSRSPRRPGSARGRGSAAGTSSATAGRYWPGTARVPPT